MPILAAYSTADKKLKISSTDNKYSHGLLRLNILQLTEVSMTELGKAAELGEPFSKDAVCF